MTACIRTAGLRIEVDKTNRMNGHRCIQLSKTYNTSSRYAFTTEGLLYVAISCTEIWAYSEFPTRWARAFRIPTSMRLSEPFLPVHIVSIVYARISSSVKALLHWGYCRIAMRVIPHLVQLGKMSGWHEEIHEVRFVPCVLWSSSCHWWTVSREIHSPPSVHH